MLIMEIGKKIFYDTSTGNVLIEVGERRGFVVETTLEQDIQTFKTLSERNPETFDFIKLVYGEYAQDFMECNGYRINPETKQLEFSYPEPGEVPPEPVYQAPLSVEVANLRELVDTMLGVTN